MSFRSGDVYGSKISASRARVRKVLSTPKKTSANGALRERIALLSAAPASPLLTNATDTSLAASNAWTTVLESEKESWVMTVSVSGCAVLGAQAPSARMNVRIRRFIATSHSGSGSARPTPMDDKKQTGLNADLCGRAGHLIADAARSFRQEHLASQRPLQPGGPDTCHRRSPRHERDEISG